MGTSKPALGYLKKNTRRNSSCSPAARRRFQACPTDNLSLPLHWQLEPRVSLALLDTTQHHPVGTPLDTRRDPGRKSTRTTRQRTILRHREERHHTQENQSTAKSLAKGEETILLKKALRTSATVSKSTISSASRYTAYLKKGVFLVLGCTNGPGRNARGATRTNSSDCHGSATTNELVVSRADPAALSHRARPATRSHSHADGAVCRVRRWPMARKTARGAHDGMAPGIRAQLRGAPGAPA
jgi:hypothetical protein